MQKFLDFIARYLILLITIILWVVDIWVCIQYGTLLAIYIKEVGYVFGAQIIIVGILSHYYTDSSLSYMRIQIDRFLNGLDNQPFQANKLSLHPDVQRIGQFAKKSLEILANFKEELRSGRDLKSEIQLAAEIQKHVLVKKTAEVPSLQCIAKSKSATEVGGDSYDIIQRNNNFYIYLGDVTGHGVASGFVMMMVNALISGFSRVLINSADILASTNEILKPRIKSNMLMTLLMLRWNEREKQLFMTGGGHEYLLVYKKEQNKVFKVKSGGIPLGVTKNAAPLLKEVQLDFSPGDIAVMYTDGITEARNAPTHESILFGVDRLVDAIEKSGIKTASGIFNAVTVALSSFMGYGNHQLDDVTLLVIHYLEGEQQHPILPIPAEQITEWNWID